MSSTVLSCHDVSGASNPLAAFAYPRTGKRGVPQQFPRRLYEMLEIESNNCTTVDATGMGYEIPLITWSDTGRAFRIADVQLFATLILPKYFRTSKFSSFQRNLNLYGFTKIRRGPETDMYAHPEFVRGQVDSLVKLRKLKTTERKSAKGPKATSSAPPSSSAASSSSHPQRGEIAEPSKRGPADSGVVTSPRIVSPSPSKLLRQSSGSSSTSSCSSSSLITPSEQVTANADNSSPQQQQQQQVMHGISIPSLLQQYQRQRQEESARNTFHIASQWNNEGQVKLEQSISLPPMPQHQYSAPPPSLPPPLPSTSTSADYGMPPLALPSAVLQERLAPSSPPQHHHQMLPQAPISAAAPAEPRDTSTDAKTGGKLALLALAMTSMAEKS